MIAEQLHQPDGEDRGGLSGKFFGAAGYARRYPYLYNLERKDDRFN